MPSEREGLGLGELNFNDGTLTLEELVFKQAAKKAQWADTPDADGAVLVDEAHYTNAYFEGRVRIEPQPDMDTALDLLGQITEAFQMCERMAAAGGLPVPWTPAGSDRTWTWYCELAEYTDLPTTITGDLAGWFLSSPVIPFKLTCRPFGHGEQIRILAPTSYTGPLQEEVLEDPGGDVPAEAVLTATDKAGKGRRHWEWGLELVDEESPPALTIDSDSLVVSGFAGTQTTLDGAYDPDVGEEELIGAVALSAATVMCSTGDTTLVGSLRVKPRVVAGTAYVRYRASFRVGDGPFRSLAWAAPPVVEDFAEVDLGEVSLDRLEHGPQSSEIRIEVKSLDAAALAYLDLLNLIPTSRGYGKARGLVSGDAPSLIGYDEFDHTAGNITGGYTTNGITAITQANPGVITCNSHGLANGDKVWIEGISGPVAEVLRGLFTVAGVTTNTFNVGVNTTGKGYASGGKVSKGGKSLPLPPATKWFGVGDPDDGAINATAHQLERTAVSDLSVGAGRFLFPGTPPLAGVQMSAVIRSAVPFHSAICRLGVYVRYRDVANWLGLVLEGDGASSFSIRVLKSVAGNVDELHGEPGPASGVGTEFALRLAADDGGSWSAYLADRLLRSGQDDDLQTGGALASGQVPLYDAWVSPGANTRVFDKVNILGVTPAGRVCYANRSLQLRFDESELIRQDAAGLNYGTPSMYRGARFYVPPRLGTGQVARIAAKLRVNDTDTEADSSVSDPQELEAWATPRVLVPR